LCTVFNTDIRTERNFAEEIFTSTLVYKRVYLVLSIHRRHQGQIFSDFRGQAVLEHFGFRLTLQPVLIFNAKPPLVTSCNKCCDAAGLFFVRCTGPTCRLITMIE